MQLSRETAAIPVVFQYSRKQTLVSGYRLPVLATACRPRITTCQKRGATWRTDRALAICMCKGDTVLDNLINVRCANERIPECMDCVVALLIAANPKDVWWLMRHRYFDRLGVLRSVVSSSESLVAEIILRYEPPQRR